MAYLTGTNRIYLFVTSEETNYSVSASTHSVEDGEDLTDHVKAGSDTISISGMLVGSGYKMRVNTIKGWEKSGEIVRYSGGLSLSRCIISNFSVSHSADVAKGCNVSMDLTAVRIAKPAYVPPAQSTPQTAETGNAGVQSVEANTQDEYHTVKSGDNVYSLVNGAYKKYGKSCQEIMDANPDAFSRPGDFTTLKVGARLKMN